MKTGKIITLTLALTMVLGSFGCGGGGAGGSDLENEKVDKNRTQLYVYNYNGGFGSDWLASAKKKYEELHKDTVYEDGKTGIQIIVQPEKTNMENEPETTLATTNELFFTEGVEYRSLVASGAFEDITSIVTTNNVYESKTIESKLTKEQKDYYKVDGNYYGIPHYLGSYGIVYDIDMFEKSGYYLKQNPGEIGEIADWFIDSDPESEDVRSAGPDGELGTGDDGLPATYEEFYRLCEYIASDSCVPLIWTGKYHDQYLTNLMTTLVANHEGLEQMILNYNLNGTAKNLGTLDNDGNFVLDAEDTVITNDNAYELARQEGKYYALEFIEKLSTMKDWHYARSFNPSFSHTDAQRIFINSVSSGKRIAMMVEGSWWESEATQAFNDMVTEKGQNYSKNGRNFGWMPLPRATTAQVGNNNTYYDAVYSLCFLKAGLSEFQKKKAMDFLQFVTTDASLVEFTQITGATKAYNYSMTNDQMSNLSPFAKSLTEYRLKADVIYPFSSNEKFVNNISTFKTKEAYYTYVDDNTFRYAPSAFHDKEASAKDWFKGMAVYYEDNWGSLN